MEKNSPTCWQPCVVKGRHVRLMCQDEARFGRMVRIRRCRAPAPQRPLVDNGYELEFQYGYGAVSPLEGELDWRICPVMNTEQRGPFLAHVSAALPEDFIGMGRGWRQFAGRNGTGGAGEHSPASRARLFAATQSTGTSVG